MKGQKKEAAFPEHKQPQRDFLPELVRRDEEPVHGRLRLTL